MTKIKNEQFPELHDLQTMKTTLVGMSEQEEFRWLGPLVTESLPDSVASYLIKNPPVPDRFAPLNIEENLAEANSLLIRCLDRRAEIMELQSTAMEFALDSYMAGCLFDSDEIAFSMQLAAYQKQATGTVDEESIKILAEARFSAIRSTHLARINLHNSPDSPLNYGERATRTKRLYCESVRSLIERAMVIESALEATYGFWPKPLPSTQSIADNLDEITWWLRGIVRQIEDVERRQTTHIVSCRVFRDLVPSGNLLDAQKTFHDTGVLKFTLTDEAAQAAGLNVPLARCRVVAVAVSIAGRLPTALLPEDGANAAQNKKKNTDAVNDAMYQRVLSYFGTVQAPDQELMGKFISMPPLDLGQVPYCFEAPPSEKWRSDDPGPILNACPVGTWQVTIGNQPLMTYKGQGVRAEAYAVPMAPTVPPPSFVPPPTPPSAPQEVPSYGSVRLGLPFEAMLQDVILSLKLIARA